MLKERGFSVLCGLGQGKYNVKSMYIGVEYIHHRIYSRLIELSYILQCFDIEGLSVGYKSIARRKPLIILSS